MYKTGTITTKKVTIGLMIIIVFVILVEFGAMNYLLDLMFDGISNTIESQF